MRIKESRFSEQRFLIVGMGQAGTGIGFNIKWILNNFRRDFGFSPGTVRVIGGGSVNDQWMQGVANITGKVIETTTEPTLAGTVGSAACAFVGSGIFKSFSNVKEIVKVKKTFTPDLSVTVRLEEQFRHYQSLYYDLKGLYRRANGARFSS